MAKKNFAEATDIYNNLLGTPATETPENIEPTTGTPTPIREIEVKTPFEAKTQNALNTEKKPKAQKALKKPKKADAEAEKIDSYKNRMNISLSEANYDFVKVMSKIKGTSYIKFINYALSEYRAQNGEIYEKAKSLLELYEGNGEG